MPPRTNGSIGSTGSLTKCYLNLRPFVLHCLRDVQVHRLDERHHCRLPSRMLRRARMSGGGRGGSEKESRQYKRGQFRRLS